MATDEDVRDGGAGVGTTNSTNGSGEAGGAAVVAPKSVSLAQKYAENFDSDDDDGLDEAKEYGIAEVMRQTTLAMRRIMVYASLSTNDAKQRKGGYCLGFCSVFIVVFITVLMFTVLGNLPILFLKLGEQEEGMLDLIVVPGGQVADAQSLNYSVVERRFPSGDYSYHAPRVIFRDMRATAAKNCQNGAATNWTKLWYPNPSNVSACNVRDGCVRANCPQSDFFGTIFYVDAAKENRAKMGEGTFPTLGRGEVILEKLLSEQLNVTVGDRIYFDGPGPSAVLYEAYKRSRLDDRADVFQQSDSNSEEWKFYTTYRNSTLTYTIVDIWEDNKMKIPDADGRFVFANYDYAVDDVAAGLSPVVPQGQRDLFAAVDPKECATQVIFNFPPEKRLDIYVDTDYDVVQKRATTFAGGIVGPLGFNQLEVEMPILSQLFANRFFALFMGLLLSIIIVTLSFLSIVLQYSLLSVNLSVRTFELAIMRMLGFTKQNLVMLVFTNAYFFALPAWVFGLIFGQLIFMFVVRGLLPVDVPATVTGASVGYATLAGLLIPLIAAIAPMIDVLSQDLPYALDADRSRVEAIHINVERAGGKINWTVVGLGIALATFGFLIYYLFPLALVNFNLTLLFYIFFGILLGMLFGLILLSLSFERVMETLVSRLFFWWWENPSVFMLIGKNLTAHRKRNRKTTLMFSMAIGFIIFVTVAFQIQITASVFRLKLQMGGEVQVEGNFGYTVIESIDWALKNEEPFRSVKGFKYTWSSKPVQSQGIANNVTLETLGRYATAVTQPMAVAPGFFDTVDEEFLQINSGRPSPYDLGEMVYSAEMSGTLLVPSALKKSMALDELTTKYLLVTQTRDENRTDVNYRDVAETAAFVDSAAVVRFSRFPQVANLNSVISLPQIITKTRSPSVTSVRDLYFWHVVIRCDEGDAERVELAMSKWLSERNLIDGVEVKNYVTESDSILETATTVNFFFIFTQVMASVICYFALTSSMSTNIHEQTKEIGILRCIGLKRFPCYRVYMWEAYTLVVAASIMGLIVGTLVAFTMTLQQILFSQLPLPFVFPTEQLITILIVSFLIAFLASYFPMRMVLNLPSITSILRKVL